MSYATENIARTLKEARERKGLSQRALSKQAGVPQGQISRIENGAVDLRLSSLIELARALDLELTLVPRKSVSAVKSIVRSSEPKAAAAPTLKELNRTLDAVKDLRAAYPDLNELIKLQSSIQSFKTLRGIGKELEALRNISRPVRELQKLTEKSRKIAEATKLPAEQLRNLQKATKPSSEQLRTLQEATKLPTEQLQALREATNAAQKLRNQLVHNIPEAPSLPRPAYSLDEDDDG
jgi:transcriptional regulator with XRE-family HTH domain